MVFHFTLVHVRLTFLFDRIKRHDRHIKNEPALKVKSSFEGDIINTMDDIFSIGRLCRGSGVDIS